MRRRIIHLLILLALLAVSLFVFALVGRSYLAELARQQIAEEISARTGLTVRLGALAGNPLSGMTAVDLEILHPRGDSLRVEEAAVAYRLRDLIGSPPRIRSLRLLRPELRLRTRTGAERAWGGGEPGRIRAPFLVEHLAVEDGRVIAGPAPAEAIELRGSLRDAEKGILFELAGLSARIETPEGEEMKVTLAGSFLIEAGSCSCEAEGSFGRTAYRGRGRFMYDGEPSGRGTILFDPLSLEEVLPLLGRSRAVRRGEARVEVFFAGEPDSLDLSVRSGGTMNSLAWEDLEASGSIRDHYVDLRSFSGRLNGAALSGSGRVDLSGKGESRLSAAFSEVDASRFGEEFAAGRPTDLNGTIRWSGEGKDLTNLEGSFAMRLGRSRFGDVSIREARIEGRAEGDGVRIEGSEIRTASSDLHFSGRIGFDGAFHGELRGGLPSLAEFRGASGIDSLAGSARLSLSVEGGPERIRAEGRASVRKGSAEGFRADSLFLEGWFEREGERVGGASRVRVGAARFQGEGVDSARIHVDLRNDLLRIDSLFAHRAAWSLRSAGSLRWGEGRKELLLEETGLYEEDTLAVEPGRILFWWDRQGYGVRPIRFSYGGGTVAVDGESPDGDSIRVRLDVDGADLSRAAGWVDLPPDILSRVDLGASVQGRSENRVGELRFNARRREGSLFPFRRVEGALFILASTVHVDSLLLIGEEESARIRAEGSFPIDPDEKPDEEVRGSVEMRDYPVEELRFLGGGLEEVEGFLDVSLHASGTWKSPVLAAVAAGSSMTVRGYPVGAIRADSIRAGADSLSFVIRLDPFWGRGNRIAGRVPFRLSPEKRSAEFLDQGPLRIELRVPNGDLAFLGLLADPLEEAMGSFTLEAKLAGDRSDPSLDGVFEVSDGLIFLSGTSLFFDRVDARFLLDEKRINVVRFRSRSGERGRLNAWGTVDLEHFRPAVYDIGFKARQYDLLPAEGVQLTFDGDLSLRPDTTLFRKVVPHISGEVDVKGALIERELSMKNDGAGSIFDPTGDPDWTMDVFLRAPQNFWIRNRTADLELGGEAQIRRSSEGLGALGTLEVLRGRYWLYNNEFRVVEGQVTFTDPADLRRADVDVTMQTDVMQERIEIRLVRDEGELQVLPTSESGYSEGEILSILTLRAHPQDEVNSGEILSSWFTSFANRLSRKVSRGLGDIGVIEIGTSEELPEIRYGNYLSSDLYLGFSQKLRTEEEREQERSPTRENLPIPERQVRVEYRLRRSLVIQGEVGTLSDGNRFLNMDLRVRLPY